MAVPFPKLNRLLGISGQARATLSSWSCSSSSSCPSFLIGKSCHSNQAYRLASFQIASSFCPQQQLRSSHCLNRASNRSNRIKESNPSPSASQTSSISNMATSNPHCAPVLKTLLERNQGWADQTKTSKPELLDSCSKGQAPKVLWIGCSDSRVPESMVTQSQPGEVFVTRNIANQFNPNDDNVVSVLTYAVEALGVEHVVIVGHESCGGVVASLAAARSAGESAPPAPQGPLQRHLSPLVALAQSVISDAANKNLSDAQLVQKIAEESVKTQMKNVANTDVLERNWKGEKSPLSGKVMEKVTVHGWIHDINTGKLRDLNCSIAPSA